ncbi:MAG: TatD family hydrolase [Candidatus Aenigmatarchaeota archaeon]|jgi:TatD DNase family protein
MIDVHCHLEHESFKVNVLNLLEIWKKDLKALITCAAHPKDFNYTLEIVKKFRNFVYASFSIHPEYIEEIDEEKLENFENFVKENRDFIVSIGEIGLDYFWIKDENLRKKQREVFERMIEIAKKFDKPITVHIRDAYEDAFYILERTNYQKVHLHMFGGDKFIDKVISNQWKISVGPILLRSKKHKRIVKALPLERIMLETDSPYIKIDNRESNPLDVKFVAQKIAEIKKVSLEEVERITDENAIKFFNLSL